MNYKFRFVLSSPISYTRIHISFELKKKYINDLWIKDAINPNLFQSLKNIFLFLWEDNIYAHFTFFKRHWICNCYSLLHAYVYLIINERETYIFLLSIYEYSLIILLNEFSLVWGDLVKKSSLKLSTYFSITSNMSFLLQNFPILIIIFL